MRWHGHTRPSIGFLAMRCNALGLFEETRAATFHPKLDDKLLGRFSIQDLAETRNLHFFLATRDVCLFSSGAAPKNVVNGDT